MVVERGLISKIALKHNWSISDAKRKLMGTATEYTKRYIKEVTGKSYEELPKGKRLVLWITALGIMLPAFWEATREKDDIPTYEEVRKKIDELVKARKTLAERLETLKKAVTLVV